MRYTTTHGTQGICPSGWHLPTDEEWKQLEGEVDSQYGYPNPEWDSTGWRGLDAGLNLKSISGWNSNGGGTDLYGFTALSSGFRFSNGSFVDMGFYTFFWSSTEIFTDDAWYRSLRYNFDEVYRINLNKDYSFSVRCLQN